MIFLWWGRRARCVSVAVFWACFMPAVALAELSFLHTTLRPMPSSDAASAASGYAGMAVIDRAGDTQDVITRITPPAGWQIVDFRYINRSAPQDSVSSAASDSDAATAGGASITAVPLLFASRGDALVFRLTPTAGSKVQKLTGAPKFIFTYLKAGDRPVAFTLRAGARVPSAAEQP